MQSNFRQKQILRSYDIMEKVRVETAEDLAAIDKIKPIDYNQNETKKVLTRTLKNQNEISKTMKLLLKLDLK
ncbi:MAG: hypothetical protein ABIH76_08030 [Candidatus Bathyarchaeota archaeon]